MRALGLLGVAALSGLLHAQPVCPVTPAYSPCELVFELNDAEAKLHPNPYSSLELRAEFRSPRHRTLLIQGFWDGGRRMMIRFTPTGEGTWDYRITSSIERWNNQQGKVEASDSGWPGFIKPANVHHWSYLENFKPHLWMGDTAYRFAVMERAQFTRLVDTRAAQKFNHIRGHVLDSDAAKVFPAPDRPDPVYFRELDQRVAYMNSKGIVADLILGRDQNHLRKLFPTPKLREQYVEYMAARFAPYNITWQLVQEFEEYEKGRDLAKELGTLLKRLDPYQHPRTTHTVATSAPLLEDGWMDHVLYQSSDDQLGSIEHQLYAVPFVNAEFGYENSGAGASHPHHVATDEFRRRLWNSTMNGQYPTYGNTGTYGGSKVPQDLRYLDAPGAKQMTVWFDFFSATRHWELEPFFDLDGGRAVALPGVEYIVYVEKPSGPIEVRVEKHGYDVKWVNPINGESIPMKDWKGEKFVAEPPNRNHDWVLHLSREGRKQGMLNSYKFESRRNLMQEIEQAAARIPFEIAEPAKEEFSAAVPPRYEVKLKRETRGTRAMSYLWIGEASADGQGYRVLGTGKEGTLRIPRGASGVFNVRLYGMNANGKVYVTDRIYRLIR